MNKLKTMLCAVFTLLLVNTAQADSGNFAGPYIGLNASAYGISAQGGSLAKKVDRTDVKNDVSVGKVAGVVGGEIGYVLPVGSSFAIDIGASYLAGEAKIETDGDDTGTNRAAFKIDDLVTYYIAPTIVLSETSSVYIKLGLSEADTGIEGDITTPPNLSGTTWALGTRTVLDSGIFIRTEAGYTDYNEISAHGKGTEISASTSYSADPTSAYGMFSMGFRF
jgi:hypothetical protein